MYVFEEHPTSAAPEQAAAAFGAALGVLSCHNGTILQNLLLQADQSQFLKMLSIYFLLLSTLSLIYGISTWVVLPNARNFQNYAYIQVVWVQALRCCAYVAHPRVTNFLVSADYFHHWFSCSFQCWLLVATLCMYQEIVIFFFSLTNFFYLANLFAWGLPAATVLLSYIINSAAVVCYEHRVILYCVVEGAVLVLNVLCYARVVLRVSGGYHVLAPSRTSRSLVKATLTVLIGAMPALLHFISLAVNNIFIDFILNLGFPSLIILVWFVCLKSNLEMWFEWCRPLSQ